MNLPVKVCGITRLADAEAALAAGAQALGFILYPKSPRYRPPQEVADLIRALPPFVVTVGVFVQEQPQEINRIAALCNLDRIQLHGDEPEGWIAQLNRPAYRAFRLRESSDITAIEAAPDKVLLLDTFDPDHFGGTGQPFNWEWARGLSQTRQVILAGGLTPQNVARALAAVQPAALDVSSGVESAPGLKDYDKLAAFFQAVQGHHFTAPSPWRTEHANTQ